MRNVVALAVAASISIVAMPANALLECSPASGGTVHYVCDCQSGAASGCVAGSDSNAGTSTASPYKTWEKARTTFNAMSAGDQVYLCKGGVWDATGSGNTLINANCGNPSKGTTAPADNQWCTVGAYSPPWGSGSEGDPYVQNIPGTTSARDGEEQAYRFIGIHMDGGTPGASLNAFFFYDDVDYVELCQMTLTGFSIAVQLGDDNGSSSCSDGTGDGASSNIHIHNSYVQNNSGQGWLGGDNGTLIDATTFVNNGFGRPILNHNVYLDTHPHCGRVEGVSNLTIQNSTFTQASVSGGVCGGAHVVAHGRSGDGSTVPTIDGLLYVGNRVYEEPGVAGVTCWGLTASPGDPESEWFRNVTIKNNRLEQIGNVSIGIASTTFGIIENNVIVNNQSMNGDAIEVPNAPENGSTPDHGTSQIVIRNNSILTDGGAGVVLTEGSSHVVVNNVFYSTATSGTSYCLDMGTSTSFTSDYNDCYAPSATLRWDRTSNVTLATWQGGGHDTHSFSSNPGFASIVYASYNLAAANGSAAIVNAGSTANGSTLDILGVSRPQGASTDIGAYEFVASSSFTAGKGGFSVFGGF